MTGVPKHLTNFNDDPIEVALMQQLAWFDDAVRVIPPMVPGFEDHGDVEQHVYSCTRDEFSRVCQRINMLSELVQLRQPIGEEWGEAMIMHHCPCGMTNDEWKAWVEYNERDEFEQHTKWGVN
jgi:hypothetical protein